MLLHRLALFIHLLIGPPALASPQQPPPPPSPSGRKPDIMRTPDEIGQEIASTVAAETAETTATTATTAMTSMTSMTAMTATDATSTDTLPTSSADDGFPQPKLRLAYNYGFDTATLIGRRSTGTQIVVGRLPGLVRQGGSNNDNDNGSDNDGRGSRLGGGKALPPVRRNIRELQSDPLAWTLYILAMSMLQFTDQDEAESWYQIAGIHGIPYVPYNNVTAIPGSEGTGYCTHSSTLFPTWHRPYMALLEQVLFDRVNRIASWFADVDERAAYQKAASTFRMPYWDWAADPEPESNVFLDVFTSPDILVNGPAGYQIIANPLYSYRFQSLDPTQFIHVGFDVWKETLRAPSDTRSADAWSREDHVVGGLNQALSANQQRLFALLSNYPRFSSFSNKRFNHFMNLSHSEYDSLEALHDGIHTAVGQGGHLQYLSYSAFDPVFFLHHTMVDRIIALWQVINPDSWVEPMPSTEATFTTGKGDVQDTVTPLTPFLSDYGGGFWDSNGARDVTAFGYTYEDLFLGAENKTEQRRRVVERVYQLYGGSSPASLLALGGVESRRRSARRHKGASAKKGIMIGSGWNNAPNLSLDASLPSPPPSTLVDGQGRYAEWLVNVRVESGSLNGSFALYFFLGSPPDGVALHEWPTAANLAGTLGVSAMLPRPGKERMSNEVSGTVYLTAALMQLISAGRLVGLLEAETLLRRMLMFRVVGRGEDGAQREVDPANVRGLQIAVASARVKVKRGNGESWAVDGRKDDCPLEMPRWGPVEQKFLLWGKGD